MFRQLMITNDEITKSKILRANNFILSRDDTKLNDGYLNQIKKLGNHEYFDANKSQVLVDRVNNLVKENTNNMIDKLLNPGDITDKTFLVLLNTIYFYSTWSIQFDKQYTQKQKFYSHNQEERNVDMMQLYEKDILYTETEDLKAIKLSYTGDEFSLLVVLPKNRNDTVKLDYNYEAINNKMHKLSVNVTLPKFTHEQEIDMIPFLKSLGITHIFENMSAKDMMPNDDGIFVSTIKQKVKIIVNEVGTEASAVTAIINNRECCVIKNTYDFIADHNFAYYIIHNKTNTRLFGGIYN